MSKSIRKKENALEIKNLSLRNHNEEILKNISMKLQANSITGIIGGSGSGKTTLFKTILRAQIPPNAKISGEILLFGEKLNKKNKIQIQPVFQDPIGYFNPKWTLREILFEPMKIRFQLENHEKEKKASTLLEEFGFSRADLDKNIKEFSGGEMQRFAIFRAILSEPKVILMDEPVSALDPLVQKDIVVFIKKIQQSKKISILFISHDIEIVGWLCENLYVMRNGELVEEGNAQGTFKNPKHEYTKSILQSTYL